MTNASPLTVPFNPTITFAKSATTTQHHTTLPLSKAMAEIRTDNKHDALIKEIRAEKDKDKKNKLKLKLPVFCFQGQFKGGESIKNETLTEFSCLFHFDIDNVNPEAVITRLKAMFEDSLAFYFISPSGNGVKGGIRIDQQMVTSDADYKTVFDQMKLIFKWHNIVIDDKCKDIRRLCYFSHDPEVCFNQKAEEYPIKFLSPSEISCHEKLLAQFDKFAPGQNHEAALKLGKIAGDMIAAGKLDEDEVIRLLTIRWAAAGYGNEHWRAVTDGIEYGKKSDSYRIITGSLQALDEPLNKEIFRHKKESSNGNISLLSTVANLECLLRGYGIVVKYDDLLKKPIITFPDDSTADDTLGDNGKFARLTSLCAMNSLPDKTVNYLPALYSDNRINPVLSWVKSVEWDRVDRLTDVINSIQSSDTVEYKKRVVTMWMVQCIAALDRAENTPILSALAKYESLLVFQGAQGVRKTDFIKSFLPREYQNYIREGTHLDPDNRDSCKEAISCWICELGELDSSFRKSDISQLKAFLSRRTDQMRLPYDREWSTYPRQTVFIGTVNPKIFLRDPSGSRRFWPLQVTSLTRLESVDVQQIWAQVYDLYIDGYAWWPDDDFARELRVRHAQHLEADPLEDLLLDKFDLESTEKGIFCSRAEIRQELGLGAVRGLDEIFEKHGIPLTAKTGRRGFNLVKRVSVTRH